MSLNMTRALLLIGLICVAVPNAQAGDARPDSQNMVQNIVIAASSSPATPPAAAPAATKPLTAEERYARRYPQPVRVGDLIGLPVLDDDDRTIGYVRQVVRTSAGKIQLIVPYRSWFGFLSVSWGTRAVAVPLEVVAMMGRQMAALDMPRQEFDKAPTFAAVQATPIGPDEMIRIAITRR